MMIAKKKNSFHGSKRIYNYVVCYGKLFLRRTLLLHALVVATSHNNILLIR